MAEDLHFKILVEFKSIEKVHILKVLCLFYFIKLIMISEKYIFLKIIVLFWYYTYGVDYNFFSYS